MDGIFKSGAFFTGCNYWASHAGTHMWRDWNAEVVDSDFKRIAAAGLTVLRVFPLWTDFQPLVMHRRGAGVARELRMGDDPLDFTPEGKAGVDPVMADHFEEFCALADKYGLKLVVGLLTGWMSGRHFGPPAFEMLNAITDPKVIRWELRFVRYMVKRFKNSPAIAAWDLGNECNCMGGGCEHDAAYVWAANITNAIRAEDDTRPVVSGMHGLRPEGVWTPEDQGELLDILTTHPYPIFTAHCDTDPINEMKNAMHATAESVMYSDIGGKPCFVEEIGTLGPMIASESIAADYIRASAFNSWAHDLRGFVWWCANEQIELKHTPYDWCDVERELGLFRVDGTPKPVLGELTRLTEFTKNFGNLPPRLTDAVCILSIGQDNWGAAYGAFMLAKQAGLDITFAYCQDEIPDSTAYMLPALSGGNSVYRHTTLAIMEKVSAGATLYMSLNDALLSPFTEYTGLRVLTRSRRVKADRVEFDGHAFDMWSNMRLVLEGAGAEVLASDSTGSPVFAVQTYGKGKIYYLNYPIELTAASNTEVISGSFATPYYAFYRAFTPAMRNPLKTASKSSPYISMTEHIVSPEKRYITLLNCRPVPMTDEIALAPGWRLTAFRTLTGDSSSAALTSDGFSLTLSKNTGAVAIIEK